MTEYRIELVKVDSVTVVSRRVPVDEAAPVVVAPPAPDLGSLLDGPVHKITAAMATLGLADLGQLRVLEVGGKTRSTLIKAIDDEIAARAVVNQDA